jgi:hypothetical protein
VEEVLPVTTTGGSKVVAAMAAKPDAILGADLPQDVVVAAEGTTLLHVLPLAVGTTPLAPAPLLVATSVMRVGALPTSERLRHL